MGLFREPLHQRWPVSDPVVGDPLQADMRGGAEQPLLQILSKPVIDSESDDQGGDARSNAQHRDPRDDPDEGLPPFGAEIAARNEEFEAHQELSAESDYGQYSGDAASVGDELGAESLLQLRIFHADHHGPGNN